MNITFDPLNRDERNVVLALLGNLEAPNYRGIPCNPQPMTTEAPVAPQSEPEKPKRKAKAKDEAPAVTAGTAALNPAMVDTSVKLPEVAAALKTVAENVPAPFVPAPPAPVVGPTAAAQAEEVKTVGQQLAQTQALTRDDLKDLLSTYAAKGPAEAEFAKSQLKDCMFKLSLLQVEKYPLVAAALAEKGWTLDQARAVLAAAKKAG